MKQAESGEVAQMKVKLEEEEHARLMEVNRLENEKTSRLREERLAIEAEKTREKVLSSLIKTEKENQILEAKAEAFLQKQIVSIQSINLVYSN